MTIMPTTPRITAPITAKKSTQAQVGKSALPHPLAREADADALAAVSSSACSARRSASAHVYLGATDTQEFRRS